MTSLKRELLLERARKLRSINFSRRYENFSLRLVSYFKSLGFALREYTVRHPLSLEILLSLFEMLHQTLG